MIESMRKAVTLTSEDLPEEFKDHRRLKAGLEFKVRWKGYMACDDSWVKCADLHADQLLNDYLLSHRL